jgi:nucleotide sugar dehydrogenase
VQSHRVLLDLRRYPKVVGGVEPGSTERAVEFYKSVLDAEVMRVRNSETAELTKLAECVYRDVNIALANELARYADEVSVDITEVIQAANSEPLSNVHEPGVGVGGHCIPVYPYFLLANRPNLPMTALARTINDGMPGWTVEKVGELLGSIAGKRVLLLGLSYRANLAEITGSVGLSLVNELVAAGATPVVADSFFTTEQITAIGAEPFDGRSYDTVDAVIIQAMHDEFMSFPWTKLRMGTVVFDGRNVLDAPTVQALGLTYLGVGRRLDG